MSLNELINKRKKLLETMDGFLETHKMQMEHCQKRMMKYIQEWKKSLMS